MYGLPFGSLCLRDSRFEPIYVCLAWAVARNLFSSIGRGNVVIVNAVDVVVVVVVVIVVVFFFCGLMPWILFCGGGYIHNCSLAKFGGFTTPWRQYIIFLVWTPICHINLLGKGAQSKEKKN